MAGHRNPPEMSPMMTLRQALGTGAPFPLEELIEALAPMASPWHTWGPSDVG